MSRVLALEPYYGGSHQQFLQQWHDHSEHRWTTLTLPAYKWKWRMRHAPITLSQQIRQKVTEGHSWDAIWASDMVNLAELRGLMPNELRDLPCVLYFHENQLTYPSQTSDPRDEHFAFTNFVSAVAADEVWFNSDFHRQQWLTAMEVYLKRLPDYRPMDELAQVADKCCVQSPGVHRPKRRDGLEQRGADSHQPLRILWNARWEHDKNPAAFFAAMESLQSSGCAVRVIVAGQSFENVPAIFAASRERLGDIVEHWGFVENRARYEQLLQQADVVVATAHHEFFGMAVVEAMLAGAFPILPRRLAYPELLHQLPPEHAADYLYEESLEDDTLIEKLMKLVERRRQGNSIWSRSPNEAAAAVSEYESSRRAVAMDARLQQMIVTAGSP